MVFEQSHHQYTPNHPTLTSLQAFISEFSADSSFLFLPLNLKLYRSVSSSAENIYFYLHQGGCDHGLVCLSVCLKRLLAFFFFLTCWSGVARAGEEPVKLWSRCESRCGQTCSFVVPSLCLKQWILH